MLFALRGSNDAICMGIWAVCVLNDAICMDEPMNQFTSSTRCQAAAPSKVLRGSSLHDSRNRGTPRRYPLGTRNIAVAMRYTRASYYQQLQRRLPWGDRVGWGKQQISLGELVLVALSWLAASNLPEAPSYSLFLTCCIWSETCGVDCRSHCLPILSKPFKAFKFRHIPSSHEAESSCLSLPSTLVSGIPVGWRSSLRAEALPAHRRLHTAELADLCASGELAGHLLQPRSLGKVGCEAWARCLLGEVSESEDGFIYAMESYGSWYGSYMP